MHNEGQTQCKHYVSRKKRFCRMSVKKGREYCGEHEPDQQDLQLTSARIPCPLDPKHTCYKHNLSKHLKICNARQLQTPDYIVTNVNDVAGEANDKRSLLNVPTEELHTIIDKVAKIHAEIFSSAGIEERFSKHEVVEEELTNPDYGFRTKRHLMQVSSILGTLREMNLLTEDACFIEFGAGKGQLSYWIYKAIEHLDNSSVLLVERAALRHKRDNKLDKSDGRVNRIKADIGDLVLDKVDCLKNANFAVGLCKHLCGDATDLALRCLSKYELCNNNGKVSGLIMATCCHHRCRWEVYAGKRFFEAMGLGKFDFDAICGMVSWATCGTGLSREKRNQSVGLKRDVEIGLGRAEMEEIGKKCKNLIDWGRLKFLEGLNFKCSLNYYVTADVSLENVCISARKRQN